MKKLLAIIIGLISFTTFAQSELTNQIKADYEAKKYDKIIKEHGNKLSKYPAKAIYYVGKAYYMKADDNNAIKTMNLSINKDNTDPAAHFIKGMTFYYMDEFDEAISSFTAAIEIDSTNSSSYSGLADSYFSQKKYDKALSFYIQASKKKDPIDRPFTMIPQIYAELNQPQKALEAFYISKQTISKESNSYINALYNIGVYEYLNKNYNKSELAFKELIEIEPKDYPSYAKLIQVYYSQKEYEKAEPFKRILYKAFENGELKGNLKSKFCFDQFEWDGKRILVYENFAVKEGELYYKHIFYIPSDKGGTRFTIQTENSPISEEQGNGKYAIGMDKNGTHSTFGFIEENFEYNILKKIVINILEEDIKPGASSRKKN